MLLRGPSRKNRYFVRDPVSVVGVLYETAGLGHIQMGYAAQPDRFEFRRSSLTRGRNLPSCKTWPKHQTFSDL